MVGRSGKKARPFARRSKGVGNLAARRQRRGWLLVGSGLVLVILAAAVTLVALRPWTPAFRHGGLTIADPPAPVKPFPQVTPVLPGAAEPSRQGLANALAQLAAGTDLGSFGGSVSDAATGTVLWSVEPDKPLVPASTVKVLTAAAALLALPPDHRVTTRVVAGANPNELVLIGDGDPTLTAVPDGKGYYPDGPRLAALVDQIKAVHGAYDTILVDSSAFAGPTAAPGWDPGDIAGGSWAPIEPIMLDGGRLDPLSEYSPRSPTPALDVGRLLATELGLDPAKVRPGVAPTTSPELARVQSAPLRDRLRQMMVDSDDVLAESIGREVAGGTGAQRSFTGAAEATTATLTSAGFDVGGVSLLDTSGLSTDDRVPVRLLDAVLAASAARPAATSAPGPAPDTAVVATGKPTSAAALAAMLDYLPVAGGTGTLSTRFTSEDRMAAGWLRAKTGTLTVSSALAGYVLDRDGRVLTFALLSNGRPPEASRPALDALAAALRDCGCS